MAINAYNSMVLFEAVAAPADGTIAYLAGYSAPGDGGGGYFHYSSSSSATADNATVVNPNGHTGNGRWLRETEGMVNVRWFGAKGDNTNDDANAIIAAVNYSNVVVQPVYFPSGTYCISKTITATGGPSRGYIGDGKVSTVIKAIASMTIALDVRGMQRGVLKDIYVSCNSLATIGINSDYSTGGPSLNNIYSNVFIDGYSDTGWHADNNNDCYFDEILIAYSSTSGSAGLRSNSGGGPLQFLNCNFLHLVYVAGQNISFVNCVTTGIVVRGAGYNVLKYEGGYAFPSPIINGVISIAADGNQGGTASQAGPITFSGSHIQVDTNQFLIAGTGVLQYGVNAIGCHIFTTDSPPVSPNVQGSLIQSTLTSILSPAATNKFSNCWIFHVTATSINGLFTNQFENCYIDSYYNNNPSYLNLITGGDVVGNLGLPGVGQDSMSRADNRFSLGNGDGASYSVYNTILRGHWGMALQTYNGTVNGYIDFRTGKIDLLDGFYVNGQKVQSLVKFNETSNNPGITSLPQYADNPTAVAALGTNKLYQTTGVVKITY